MVGVSHATDIVQNVTKNETLSSDPLILGISFVAIVVVTLVAAAKPLMGLFREYKRTSAEGKKSDADGAAEDARALMFAQMQQTMLSHTAAIESLQKDRERWFREALELRHEVERLKVFERQVNSMKARLDEKDRLLESRDKEIRELTRLILQMKDRIHALEMKLSRDDAKGGFCEATVNP